MSKVTFDISLSLDGYLRAANPTPAEPLGAGGERLHDWFTAPDNEAYVERAHSTLGAVICGRTTYNDSLPWWGPNGPTGSARIPTIVATHTAPSAPPPNGVYRFATDGIESALRQAQLLAGPKDVTVMGGASVGQQYLAAGLIDELSLHIVPVLLNAGTRVFDNLHAPQLPLDLIDVISSEHATHVHYRVPKT